MVRFPSSGVLSVTNNPGTGGPGPSSGLAMSHVPSFMYSTEDPSDPLIANRVKRMNMLRSGTGKDGIAGAGGASGSGSGFVSGFCVNLAALKGSSDSTKTKPPKPGTAAAMAQAVGNHAIFLSSSAVNDGAIGGTGAGIGQQGPGLLGAIGATSSGYPYSLSVPASQKANIDSRSGVYKASAALSNIAGNNPNRDSDSSPHPTSGPGAGGTSASIKFTSFAGGSIFGSLAKPSS